ALIYITVFLSLNLSREQPSISITYSKDDKMPVPISPCNEYITQPNIMDIGDSLRPLVGKFLPNGNIMLYNSQSQRINLNITINDNTNFGRYTMG
ncbi:5148_t:CDS:2, partial [Gigaspora rosea]